MGKLRCWALIDARTRYLHWTLFLLFDGGALFARTTDIPQVDEARLAASGQQVPVRRPRQTVDARASLEREYRLCRSARLAHIVNPGAIRNGSAAKEKRRRKERDVS